jgi:hypothetical protein
MSRAHVTYAIASADLAVHSPNDMSRPTAAELITRLREIYAAKLPAGEKLSDETLVAKLPITMSTFHRWKKEDTKTFRAIVTMLDDAGWLTSGEATHRPSDETETAQPGTLAEVRFAISALERLEALLRAQRKPPQDGEVSV